MKKLESLRKWMQEALPVLQREPERLQLFADEGRIACTAAAGLSFEYRYKITLQLWDFAGHPDAVMVPLLAWMGVYERERLQSYASNAEAITFAAELLDAGKVDLEIKVDVSERVQVIRRPDGTGCDVRHLPEPFEDRGDVRTWTLHVAGEQVAQWQAPDGADFP